MTLATFAHSEVLAPFFLLVGMQLRSEITHVKQILLPTFAAIGGMALPALIFYAINRTSSSSHGWPVVMPTDIALVMAVLLLLGKRVSSELKTFMLAIAVADDLFSIIILGVKYSDSLRPEQMLASIGAVVVGVLLWKAPHQEWLTRFVNFLVLPIYIFANIFPTLTHNFALTSKLGNSIVISRVLGKVIGIVLFTWIATKVRFSLLPEGLTFMDVFAGGLLAGMGLAVSFLIANLTFADLRTIGEARAGLFVSALISGSLGAVALLGSRRQ
jgi:NhaA family Na+:H+ antiporter